MPWTPIVRGKPEIRGVHPKHSGLLDVRIRLTPSPPREWVQFFETAPGVIVSLGMHRPKLYGPEIAIMPPDVELEAYVAHVDERISSANQNYEQHVLPGLLARQQREKLDAEERERRINAARKRVKDL